MQAAVTGMCSNCHTMHNSQDNTRMDDFALGENWASTGPNEALLRGTCLGCHGMDGTGTERIVTLSPGAGESKVPQVYHNDPLDLAGGNFAYITGAKGSGASNRKGHNVIDLGVAYYEDVLFNPPGAHHASQVTAIEFTCAGNNGCHGTRWTSDSQPSGIPAIKGAHHKNVNGLLTTPTEVHTSYRFLRGVQGLENNGANPWQNWSDTEHNEYFGAIQPMDIVGCDECHPASDTSIVEPSTGTISGFCGTCHGTFHSVAGIGGDTSSPFTRHPTDKVIPSTGEYATYIAYTAEAPVGRTNLTVIDPVVYPGTDVVTCLSCHVAHASDNPDMLRWDYSAALTGGGGSGVACFVCHTTK
jgi:predicted CXXCH cytochrome family protein